MNSGQADTAPRLTPKGRATRERILATAADLILRHGVTGAGIDDVRAAAGVSGSQMTHYFRDKQQLVKAVVAWQAQSVLTEHRAPQLGELDTFAALRLWADLAGGFTEWLELFRHGFALMRDRGDLLPAADPDSLAPALLAAMQGGMLLTQTLRDTAPLRASLDAALTYIGTFAADPDTAAKALRLPLPGARSAV